MQIRIVWLTSGKTVFFVLFETRDWVKLWLFCAEKMSDYSTNIVEPCCKVKNQNQNQDM